MPHVSTAKQLDRSWLNASDIETLPTNVIFKAQWRRRFIAYLTQTKLGRVTLSKMNWNLPLLDVYELIAGEEGIPSGVVMVTPCRTPFVSCNYCVLKPGTWDSQYPMEYVLSHQTKLKLRHVLHGLRFFTYGANLTLVVADNLTSLKLKLEL
jgi:hypothetical protein